MKDMNYRQGNKQKDHQSIRDSKWGNWRGSKIKQRDAERGEEKGKRELGRSICQGKSAVFQAQCLCAIWITAGFSCLRLFYIKLRQLLDFPHYCHGIGLIQCPSMFSPSSASIRRDLLSQVAGHLSPSAHCYGGHYLVWAMYGKLHAELHIIRKQVCHSTMCSIKELKANSIVVIIALLVEIVFLALWLWLHCCTEDNAQYVNLAFKLMFGQQRIKDA